MQSSQAEGPLLLEPEEWGNELDAGELAGLAARSSLKKEEARPQEAGSVGRETCGGSRSLGKRAMVV